jgi:hypothetical protein
VNYHPNQKHPVRFLDCFIANAHSGTGGFVLSDYGVIKQWDMGKGNDEINICREVHRW